MTTHIPGFMIRDRETGFHRYIDPDRPALADPDGCSWCDVAARAHSEDRWHPLPGLHPWTPPSDRQRLERMKARRTARRQQALATQSFGYHTRPMVVGSGEEMELWCGDCRNPHCARFERISQRAQDRFRRRIHERIEQYGIPDLDGFSDSPPF
ncbi:hypothetical protein [Streptomyces sp. AC1-42T]|uniref:hypothetical protein n=1 Tax=Streptomyces sp. AC1-42T TaxID=2218665 RepID=UPI000DAD075B|nr:hypothetical protein [Streptomyces sp. AC1-42T]PZT71414.1 hypothetical protein DNK55_32390 [Streptomyces sp. AC1-42T]